MGRQVGQVKMQVGTDEETGGQVIRQLGAGEETGGVVKKAGGDR